MVVICLQVCWSHDGRESTWTHLVMAIVWTISWNLARPQQRPSMIPTDMFTREIRQNVKSATVRITNAQKILLIFLSRSFRQETWHCSADIQGPLSVNLPELPIRDSEELEVGNGNYFLHPKKSPIFLSRSVNFLVRMVIPR